MKQNYWEYQNLGYYDCARSTCDSAEQHQELNDKNCYAMLILPALFWQNTFSFLFFEVKKVSLKKKMKNSSKLF